MWSKAPNSDRGNVWPFDWGRRTYVMGVLNLTPDSFSGDGLLGSAGDAIARRGKELAEAGADLLDVGGESTRPAHVPVPASEEARRVLPALTALGGLQVPRSIDTHKAAVAAEALRHGATVVNDVSGLGDDDMAAVVAAAGAGLIIVHPGPPSSADVMAALARDLGERVDRAVADGVDLALIAVDPGLGFGKDWRLNLQIMRRLGELHVLGLPLAVGPSRKGTIGHVLGTGVDQRLEGTTALVTLAITAGADLVRVHDVREVTRAVRMTDALVRPGSE